MDPTKIHTRREARRYVRAHIIGHINARFTEPPGFPISDTLIAVWADEAERVASRLRSLYGLSVDEIPRR